MESINSKSNIHWEEEVCLQLRVLGNCSPFGSQSLRLAHRPPQQCTSPGAHTEPYRLQPLSSSASPSLACTSPPSSRPPLLIPAAEDATVFHTCPQCSSHGGWSRKRMMMSREGRGLGEQRHLHYDIFRLKNYIFNNHNFSWKKIGVWRAACVHSLLLVPAAEEKVRGRERERGERGEKTQRVISPPRDWSQSQDFVLVGSRKEEPRLRSPWEPGGVSWAPGCSRDCLTWEARTTGISFLQWLCYCHLILFESFHCPVAFGLKSS